jgi:hypothetical protein
MYVNGIVQKIRERQVSLADQLLERIMQATFSCLGGILLGQLLYVSNGPQIKPF